MNPTRVIIGVLLRAATFVAATAAAVFVVGRSDSDDALGAGLLVFLVLVTIAFAWGLTDGIRSGFVRSLVTWVLTGVLAGVGIPAVFALVGDGTSVADEVANSAVFFGFLVFLPAVVGCCIGGVAHRLSSRQQTAA